MNQAVGIPFSRVRFSPATGRHRTIFARYTNLGLVWVSTIWYNLSINLGVFWSSRTLKPDYSKDGIYRITGKTPKNVGCAFELSRDTWENHILIDRSRWYLGNQFDKVIGTLQNPDYILQSPTEHNVAADVKKYDDLHILDTVMARAYLYVLVNLNNLKIRTVYSNPDLKTWKKIWPKN
jgi:hypothetical protein